MQACTRSNPGQHFTKATSHGNLQEKCRGPEAGPALCASLRGRNSCQRFTSDFIRKLTGKMPRPRLSPERRDILCASLRSRNAGQHFTKATLYGNLQYRKNAVVRLEHPDQAPAFTPTVRSPQCQHTVWGKIMSHSYPQLCVYLEKKQPCPSLPAAKYLLGRPMRYLFMLRLDIVLVRCSVWTRVASSNQVWVKPHPVLMQQKVKLSQTKVQHQQLHRGTYFCLHIATDAFFCTCKNTLHENKR